MITPQAEKIIKIILLFLGAVVIGVVVGYCVWFNIFTESIFRENPSISKPSVSISATPAPPAKQVEKTLLLLYISDGDVWQSDGNGENKVKLIDADNAVETALSPAQERLAYAVEYKKKEQVVNYDGEKEERELINKKLLLADRQGTDSILVKDGVVRWGWVSSTSLLWYETSSLQQIFDWLYAGDNNVWIFDPVLKKAQLIAGEGSYDMLGLKWSPDGSKVAYVGYKVNGKGQFQNLVLKIIDRQTNAKKNLFDIPYVGGDRGGPPPIPSFYWDNESKYIYTAFTPLINEYDNQFFKDNFKSGYLSAWKVSVDGSGPVTLLKDEFPAPLINDEFHPRIVFSNDFSKILFFALTNEQVKNLKPNEWIYYDY